jgi:hypothetical protein
MSAVPPIASRIADITGGRISGSPQWPTWAVASAITNKSDQGPSETNTPWMAKAAAIRGESFAAPQFRRPRLHARSIPSSAMSWILRRSLNAATSRPRHALSVKLVPISARKDK